MTDATVNIIIPFYNAGATLAKTLASVESQTYKNWCVILIDDGSADSSSSIAENFIQRNAGKGKIFTSLRARSGPAVGRNLAIQKADGLYIICLDADDLLAPFCLEQRVAVMQQNADLDWAVFNQYQCRPGEEAPYQLFNLPAKTREEAIAYFLKMETAWQTTGPIWKTQAIRKLGGFDQTLYPSEDPDIHLRALLDNDLNMKIMFDLPADCYYFVDNKSDDKKAAFWRDSINSKFKFIKKTAENLAETVPAQKLKTSRQYVRKGFFYFVNTFLLSRFNEYNTQLKENIHFLQDHLILSKTDILYLKIIIKIFTSSAPAIKVFRIRGAVHRLLLQNN